MDEQFPTLTVSFVEPNLTVPADDVVAPLTK
jgi:hypothetical protein